MTALAMIIGMLPMALGLGEGGEQNAPLGRAVIGGLIFATFSTLFFVPIVYSFLRKKPPINQDEQIEHERHEKLEPASPIDARSKQELRDERGPDAHYRRTEAAGDRPTPERPPSPNITSRRGKVILVSLLLAAVVAAVALAGYLPRKQREEAAARRQAKRKTICRW